MLLAPSRAALTFDGRQLFETHKRAVVKIEVTGWLKDGKDRKRSQANGSGFIVYSEKSRTVILTAAHVIGPKSQWDDEGGKPTREISVSGLDDHGKLIVLDRKAYVYDQDDESDWAILFIDGEGYRRLEMGNPLVGPGTSTVLIGYDDGSQPRYTDGKVTTATVRNGFVLSLNIEVRDGQSGGPILDEQGRVLGIASSNESRTRGDHIAVPISEPRPKLQVWVPDRTKRDQKGKSAVWPIVSGLAGAAGGVGAGYSWGRGSLPSPSPSPAPQPEVREPSFVRATFRQETINCPPTGPNRPLNFIVDVEVRNGTSPLSLTGATIELHLEGWSTPQVPPQSRVSDGDPLISPRDLAANAPQTPVSIESRGVLTCHNVLGDNEWFVDWIGYVTLRVSTDPPSHLLRIERFLRVNHP